VYTREVLKRLERIYTERQDEGFDQEKRRAEDKRKGRVFHRLKKLEKYACGKKRILDAGCGAGNFIEYAAALGWDGYGVDLTGVFIDYLKLRGVKAEQKNIEKVDYPDGFFSVVLLWDVLEHVLHPVVALETINRILADRGLLCLRVPNVERYEVKKNGWLPLFQQHRKQNFLIATGDHVNHFSYQDLKNVLLQTGFVDIQPSFSPECAEYEGWLKETYLKMNLFMKRIWFLLTGNFRVGQIVIYCRKGVRPKEVSERWSLKDQSPKRGMRERGHSADRSKRLALIGDLSKNIHIWLPSYLWAFLRRTARNEVSPKHVIFMMADHFEPFWGDGEEVMRLWEDRYPLLAEKHFDSDGVALQHTWFYPIENYSPHILDRLGGLCQRGFGEIEVHLHHDNDNEESLREMIRAGTTNLIHHGALTNGLGRRPRFGFIHGNWALNNSRKDGRWCGVNDELRILKEEGCYADFSLPSAPSETQTKKINSIYYAKSNPEMKKGHNHGVDVCVGGTEAGDLMIIQGPLTLNWSKRRYGLIPHIENGDISEKNPANSDRIKLWEKQHIHVKGRPEWIFIKIHCHGGQKRDMEALLGKEVDEIFNFLESMFRDREGYHLHYVTARECYNIIKATESDERGNPSEFRDYLIPPPQNRCRG
jgi:2-polyprenyl-3-methyl-5-hydroxy-6-metoxy-1,4-benzoquinol methylase